jgi:hypothetical protein
MTHSFRSFLASKTGRFGSFTGAVAVLVGILVLSVGGHRMSASAATTGPTPGVATFRNGSTYSVGTGFDRYSMITVGVADASAAAALPGRSLVYMSGTSVQTSWSTGVPYDQALANGWLLKDSSGSFLRTPYSAYVGDVGSSAYQQAFINNVANFLSAHGDSGVFIDDMYMSIDGWTATPVKYPTQVSWENATASFAAAVGSALKAKGFYVMFNSEGYIPGNGASDTGALTVTWWQRLAPYANGLLVEDWLQNPGNTSQLRSNGSAWNQNWSGWQSLVATAQSMGVDFFPSVSGTTTSIATMRYGKASFLLDWNGGGSAMIYSPSSGDPWNLEWTMDIGLPSASKYQVGVGWRREYTGGTALVNPSATTSQVFSLGGTYYQADGTAVTSVTLAPTSGIVLRKNVSSPPVSTSAPVNSAVPVVSGSAQSGSTLSTSTGSWTGSPTAYSYQWQRCASSCVSVSGATGASYSLTSADVGQTLRAVVTATNAVGSASAASAVTSVVATSSSTVTAPSNSAAPVVSGTPQTGKTLATSTGSWSGSPTSYKFQWQRCASSGASCASVAGATSVSYSLTNADVGQTMRAVVTATNPVGSTPAASPITSVVATKVQAVTAPTNSAAPVVSGTPQAGKTLTASTGSWAGSPTAYTFQWLRCSSSGSSCGPIAGATGSSYVLQTADVGFTARVTVVASTSAGSNSATSAATAVVTAATGTAPLNLTLPLITVVSGTTSTLTVSVGTWSGSPTSYVYKWERCPDATAPCVVITGQTASTYTLTSADVGSYIKAEIRASNSFGATVISARRVGPVRTGQHL